MDRVQKLLRKPLTAILISMVFGFIVGAIVLMIAGYNPIDAYKAMFVGIFSKPKNIAQVVIKSTPLILSGLSVAFAFKTGLFNIGAEGQYLVGSMVAVLVGTQLNLPPVIYFFVVIIIASLAAGVWGAISGWLKSKFGIHEVITCIMLNWIALYLNNYLLNLPWLKKPGSESSYEISKNAWSVVLQNFKTSNEGREYLLSNPILADTILKTDLNYGIVVAVIVVIAVWFVLNRTTKGYELRSVGFNPDASKFAGIDVKRNIILSMFIAGAIAGLAGALQITGVMPHRITLLAAHEGFGFDGITVALIANNAPIACIFAGLLFGGLKFGSTFIQSVVGAPSEIINIVIGTIVFFIAMSSVFKMISDYMVRKGGTPNAK